MVAPSHVLLLYSMAATSHVLLRHGCPQPRATSSQTPPATCYYVMAATFHVLLRHGRLLPRATTSWPPPATCYYVMAATCRVLLSTTCRSRPPYARCYYICHGPHAYLGDAADEEELPGVQLRNKLHHHVAEQ